jgi:hypothetical protein
MIQTSGSERQAGRLRRAGCHCFLLCLAAQAACTIKRCLMHGTGLRGSDSNGEGARCKYRREE